jgi:hypothetical protein
MADASFSSVDHLLPTKRSYFFPGTTFMEAVTSAFQTKENCTFKVTKEVQIRIMAEQRRKEEGGAA